MKKYNWLLASLALVLVLTAGMGSAWAYFTTYVEAKGGYTIHLGDETKMIEEFQDWTKKVIISSKEGSTPVYVRVKAFCGEEYALQYSDAAGKWQLGADGYYYYQDILAGGLSTSELDILIKNIPMNVEIGTSFNVVVVYECTPVQNDENGNPYADWNYILVTSDVTGGAE